MQVAETFTFEVTGGGPSLFDVSRLDTCVTVVDAANFYTNFHSVSPANEEDAEDERTVVDLMVAPS
jgi:G3E family GTPase